MEQYSERNPYADHLVEVNKHNPVVTTQDICNSLGATVIPEGTFVTEDVANKIARFKLLLPIELQVNLTSTILPNELFDSVRLAQSNVLGEIELPDITKELIRQCGLIHSYPLISQKLTVFADRMPIKYGDTQSAASFALSIGMQLGLDDETMDVIFAAAQMHDAGFLNINPDMVGVIDQLPDGERRALHKQQLTLGAEFLNNVPDLPKGVSRAVVEHKERKDGSGWPQGIIGDSYSIEGQVVGVSVMLFDAYAKKLKPRGYGAQHLLPLAQIESEAIDGSVFNAVVEMLRQHSHANSLVLPEEFMPPLANYLVVLQRILIHWLELAKSCAEGMQDARSIIDTERSMKIISSLEELYRNSGLWESDIRTWLSDVSRNDRLNEFSEVETVALMFESILSKLKRLHWSMREAAKFLGSVWINRCDDLATLLHGLPKDHFEAFEKYQCFE